MPFYKLLATFFGIGYIGKGAGTVAAGFVGLLLYTGAALHLHPENVLLAICILVFIVGVFVSNQVEQHWGKDNKRVVIDEVLGMGVTMLFVPITATTLFTGFILFRFFDIRKPLYIRKLENLKGGWGVMVDDLGAGVYSNIILQIVCYFFYQAL